MRHVQPMITQKSGISIALVIVIIGGIVANVSMMFTLRGDIALVSKDVENVSEDTGEIRAAVEKLTDETRLELSSLRGEVVELRGRVRELESR
tara:strand:+ start:376 stop:654 length:279 start_codon:yes stop_codon:yes gene_type:complete